MTAPTRDGIESRHLSAEARQDHATADEFRFGDDIGVGDPPADGAIRLDRERLDLTLHDHMIQPAGCEERDEGRRRSMVPAQVPAAGVQTVRREPERRDEQARGVPQDGPRLVVDGRCESDGPGPGRTLDPQLGAAVALDVRPGQRTVIGQRTAALG